jgi:hypothetical protein
MLARIYKPAKTAMQSGLAKTKEWVLDYEPASPREVEPLMGWTSSGDTLAQVRLFFETQEEAIEYAKENNITLSRFRASSPRAFEKILRRQFQIWTDRKLDALGCPARQ